MRQIVGFISVH